MLARYTLSKPPVQKTDCQDVRYGDYALNYAEPYQTISYSKFTLSMNEISWLDMRLFTAK